MSERGKDVSLLEGLRVFALFCFLVGSAFGYHVKELRVAFSVTLQSLWDKIKAENM